MRLKQQITAPAAKSSDPNGKGGAAASFPKVRYFHVHFEYLEIQLQQALQALEVLQLQMARLERRFGIAEDQAGGDNTRTVCAQALEDMAYSRRGGKTPPVSPGTAQHK